MSTSTLNIRTDQKIKSEAQRIALELGLDLNDIVNAYIHQFVRTRTVFFSLDYEEPTDYLVKTISKAKEEHDNGEIYSFNDPKKAFKFLEQKSKKK